METDPVSAAVLEMEALISSYAKIVKDPNVENISKAFRPDDFAKDTIE